MEGRKNIGYLKTEKVIFYSKYLNQRDKKTKMKLFKYLKQYGLKKGIQVFAKECKKWYKDNKLLLWVIIFIILSGIVPIFPSSSTETFRLDVPYTEEDHNILEYGIEIREECNNFYVWDDIEKIKIRDEYTIYQNNNKHPSPKAITQKFQKYTIGIFAIKACDECIQDDSLSVLDQKSCLMNQSSVFGYFEECSKRIAKRI